MEMFVQQIRIMERMWITLVGSSRVDPVTSQFRGRCVAAPASGAPAVTSPRVA